MQSRYGKDENDGDDHTYKMTGSGDTIDRAAESLLSDLSGWRRQLARNIARNNYSMRSREISAAVHRIIFRLLLLRIAEDRGLLKNRILEDILVSEYPYGSYLECSGKLDDPTTHQPPNPPVIDDEVIRTILSRLCADSRPYHFTAISTEMVGRVIRHYMKRAIRRAAADYAGEADPNPVAWARTTMDPAAGMVDYMVRITIDPLLEGRSGQHFPPVRILDPACGPGTALLSLYAYLIGSDVCCTFDTRRKVLLSSVFGVDNDPQCIMAAKLLLLMKLLEGESAASLPGDFFVICRDTFEGLGHSLLCGNALVDPSIEEDDLWRLCPHMVRQLLAPFDWDRAFPEILSSGGFDAIIGISPPGILEYHSCLQHYFQQHYAVYHPNADFLAYLIEKGLGLLSPGGALSCIVANTWMRGTRGRPLRNFLLTCQIEELVDFGGPSDPGNATPYPWIVRVSRNEPSHEFAVSRIENRERAGSGGFGRVHRYTVDQRTLTDGGWTLGDTRVENLLQKLQNTGTPLEEYVMGGLYRGIRIGSVAAFLIDEPTRDKLVEEDPKSAEILRPFLSGKEIRRYQTVGSLRYLISLPKRERNPLAGDQGNIRKMLGDTYPAVARYLGRFLDDGQDGSEMGGCRQDLSECGDYHEFEKPKIMFPDPAPGGRFSLDENGSCYCGDTVGILATDDKFLLGVLNSRLITFVCHRISTSTSGKDPEFFLREMGRLPIYTIDFDSQADRVRHDRLVMLVMDMLALQKHFLQAGSEREKHLVMQEIGSTDRQIDSLVYGLYGLAADEISAVEADMRE